MFFLLLFSKSQSGQQPSDLVMSTSVDFGVFSIDVDAHNVFFVTGAKS